MHAEKISYRLKHGVDTRTTCLMLAFTNLVLIPVSLGMDLVAPMIDRSGKLARNLSWLLLLELVRILRAFSEEFQCL
jgi:hypothetical protein